MPVFTETSTDSRDLRVLASYAPPLPEYPGDGVTQAEGERPHAAEGDGGIEQYDVVVVGAGPAGLMLTLLLSRYGLSDSQLLCIDSKPSTLRSGQADGLQPRTLEVLKSLGLSGEIVTEGCQLWEVGFWNPTADGKGIERTAYVPDVAVPARFPHEITIHQGRIERILADDLARYSKRGVQFSTTLKKLTVLEGQGLQYPVELEVEVNGANKSITTTKKIRARYVCGADGAHSAVRRDIGLALVGESKDYIWGVTDFVVDSDFPDIRRRTAIHSEAGSVMVIPRERIANGDYLTRLYVQVDDSVPPEDTGAELTKQEMDRRNEARSRRANVSFESILAQAQKVLAPYTLKMKEGAIIDWWAAYQIGQRMTEKFIKRDATGIPRVFILGDACHTHSPKAGQGMNVSMMDSYNIAWKLAYHVKGLFKPEASIKILESYEAERQKIARELIDFDTKFSSMFSGKIGANGPDASAAGGLTHEQFVEVFSTGNGFTSGCGIEYPESELVKASSSKSPIRAVQHEREYLDGILKPGRRLLDVRVIRHADSNPRALQDDFPSTARTRILFFTSPSLLSPAGPDSQALSAISRIMSSYPPTLLELTILHNEIEAPNFTEPSSKGFSVDFRGTPFQSLPPAVKLHAEMRFHSAIPDEPPAKQSARNARRYGAEDAYEILGVDKARGACAVVRPDGYVGWVGGLDEVEGEDGVEGYLKAWLREL